MDFEKGSGIYMINIQDIDKTTKCFNQVVPDTTINYEVTREGRILYGAK